MTDRTVTELRIGAAQATRLDARIAFRHPRLRTTGSELRIVVVDSTPLTYYFNAVPKEQADLVTALDQAASTLALE